MVTLPITLIDLYPPMQAYNCTCLGTLVAFPIVGVSEARDFKFRKYVNHGKY